ncbi:MAG: hypothetical protein RLZZ283_162 [Candidatus Parcubacteria bacterium]
MAKYAVVAATKDGEQYNEAVEANDKFDVYRIIRSLRLNHSFKRDQWSSNALWRNCVIAWFSTITPTLSLNEKR